MSNLICSICLGNLKLKDDKIHSTNCGHIFHLSCLNQSLQIQSNQCPSCRKQNIQHFQLFFDTEDDIEGAKCLNFSCTNEATNQLNIIIKKLDNLSLKVQSLNFSKPQIIQRTGNPTSNDVLTELLSRIEKLQKENEDLKEIHEMEEIVLVNAEKEIAELKEEILQRNDIINSLQLQNDNLRDETNELRTMNASAHAVRNDDLINLQ